MLCIGDETAGVSIPVMVEPLLSSAHVTVITEAAGAVSMIGSGMPAVDGCGTQGGCVRLFSQKP